MPNFLKLNNHEVIIKVRVCADVRKQWNWMYKEDTTSSTMYTESIMMLCMIDPMERRDLENSDIPGAFLKTD